LHLLLKDFRILLLGVQPVTAFVRLQLSFAQQSTHVTGGNGLDDSTFHYLVDDLKLRPASNRATGFFHCFARDRKDHRELLGRECWWTTGTLPIRKKVFDGWPEI
jgi:hypothetical protein